MPIDELKRLVRHACKLNNWKVREFKRQADKAMVIWHRRSDLRWKIDWGPYKEAVSDAKTVRIEREIRLEKATKAARKAKAVQAVGVPFPGIDFDGDGPVERKRSGDRVGQKRRYRERQKSEALH